MFDERIGTMNGGDPMASIARSMEDLAGAQTLTLFNRYETRIHCAFQHALRNLLMLHSRQEPNEPKDRAAATPSNPKTASEHSPAGVLPAHPHPAQQPAGTPNEPKTPPADPIPTAPAASEPATQPSPEPNGSGLPNEPKLGADEQSGLEASATAPEDPVEHEFITVYL
jgi:hypothetical protein